MGNLVWHSFEFDMTSFLIVMFVRSSLALSSACVRVFFTSFRIVRRAVYSDCICGRPPWIHALSLISVQVLQPACSYPRLPGALVLWSGIRIHV